MLKQTIKKIFKPKSFIALALVLLVILVAPVKTAHATVSETVLDVLGWGISFFVSSLGMLLSVVISAMIEVAQYNKFLLAPPVAIGWGIVRDLCNMFFVLILLIIAFATILHIPNYSIKQLLKRVVIFAILINFSKMICGLLIDFAQVIMLTFVNGFKDIGGANMSTLLGMDGLLSINIDKQIADMPDKATFWSVVGSYFLALVYVIIMLVVMVALLGTLVFRIVTLWIYIILSPMAYLGAVVPLKEGKGINSTWWKGFTQSLITGPILAFFIWLSLATLGQYKSSDTFLQQTGFNVPDPINAPLASNTDVGTTGHMMRFAISISLLIGGLMVAKQFGGAAGAAAGAGMSRIQGGAGWLKKNTLGRASNLAQRGAIAAAKGTGRAAWGGAKATGRVGLGLARTVDYKLTPERFTRGDKGLLTRGASLARQSLMTKEGLKDTFNKSTGNVFNKRLNRERAAAATAGYHVDKGVKYKLQENGSLVSENDQVHPMKAFKPGSFFHNFYQQKMAGKGASTQDIAQIAQDKKEQEEAVKLHKDKSKEQLQSQWGTANHQDRLGLAGKLAELGGFKDQKMFDEAKAEFKNNPTKMKDFLEAAWKKQPELVFDTGKKKNEDGTETYRNLDDRKALSDLFKKKKVKLEDLNLSTIDVKEKDEAKKEENLKNLGDILDLVEGAIGSEAMVAQLKKIEETGDPAIVEKLHEGYNFKSKNQVVANNRNLAEMRAEGKPTEEVVAEEDKLNAKLMDTRAKSLTLDPNGDLVKAFTDAFGRFDETMATKFLSQASASQIANINPNSASLKDPLTALSVEKAVANGLNYQKLLTLFKSNKNPDMVNFGAKALAKYNHPDSEKIVYNINNDIDFDLKSSKQNKVIQYLMKQIAAGLRAKGINPNDLTSGRMEAFRKITDAKDQSQYKEGKGGGLKAGADLERLFKAHFGI